MYIDKIDYNYILNIIYNNIIYMEYHVLSGLVQRKQHIPQHTIV